MIIFNIPYIFIFIHGSKYQMIYYNIINSQGFKPFKKLYYPWIMKSWNYENYYYRRFDSAHLKVEITFLPTTFDIWKGYIKTISVKTTEN